ncbi:Uncharacterized protein GBIM_07347, partial [Gryllus bimaculatus]
MSEDSFTLFQSYFSLMAVLMGRALHEEREYLQGNASAPQTSSVLEPDTISHESLALSAVWLCCASSGILTSLLLIFGIYRVEVEPIKAVLFTFDFFLISLNLYALLCVVSQYQEYRAGRGTAAHQRNSPKVSSGQDGGTSSRCGCQLIYHVLRDAGSGSDGSSGGCRTPPDRRRHRCSTRGARWRQGPATPRPGLDPPALAVRPAARAAPPSPPPAAARPPPTRRAS